MLCSTDQTLLIMLFYSVLRFLYGGLNSKRLRTEISQHRKLSYTNPNSVIITPIAEWRATLVLCRNRQLVTSVSYVQTSSCQRGGERLVNAAYRLSRCCESKLICIDGYRENDACSVWSHDDVSINSLISITRERMRRHDRRHDRITQLSSSSSSSNVTSGLSP